MYIPRETVERINSALKHPDPAWGFHKCLGDLDVKDMDRMLVIVEHPLAYQPGNPWQRFQSLHNAGFQF
jgi:hypothetical protein